MTSDSMQNHTGRLSRQYFLVFVVLLGGGLITSGVLELYFRYRESREQIAAVQGEIANSAAQRIAQFILTIEDHMKAATVSPVVARQGIGANYQFELAKLLATTPAITDVLAIGANGQLSAFASRFRVEPSAAEQNLVKAPGLLRAKQGITYFGPVTFVDDTEPSMTMAVPIERFPGNVIGALQAQVDLRHIWQVVRDLKFSDTGYAYVVSRVGNLIAHSNPSLTLQRLRASPLTQVQVAFQPNFVAPTPRTTVGRSFTGQEVLSSFVFLPNLEWAVFVEQPVGEAYKNLYGSILRTSALLLIGVGMALIASVFVGRRVVRPLAIVRAGVERIGEGDLDHRIEIKTNNEIEVLAEEFNKMVGQIKNAQQNLEDNVQQRTKELSALLDVTATAVESLDIDRVLRQVAEKITTIFDMDTTRIYLLENGGQSLRLRAIAGEQESGLFVQVLRTGETVVGNVAKTGERLIFEDIQNDSKYAAVTQSGTLRKAGFRFHAVFAIKAKGAVLGTITCSCKRVRRLSFDEIRLIESLINQITPAIENLNLFGQVRQKSAELEKANSTLSEYSEQLTRSNMEIQRANQRLLELDRLKSHFLSNVSHELRTPLTAIISLVDNMLDGVTGTLNNKQTRYITDVKDSSERLARLINDLLDLSMIESGKVKLERSRFSIRDLVYQVANTMTAVAQAKMVALELPVAQRDEIIWADRDRIAQVLTNLIGNAIKFTPKTGTVCVTIGDAKDDDLLPISVSDSGPGIPEDERLQIFNEFYQLSRPGEEKARGVGLGLAISKKLVEMNGGQIGVESKLGDGSTFTFTVPAFRENLTTAPLHGGT